MPDSTDFLRDPDDVAEVLEACGRPASEDRATRGQRARKLLRELPTEELIAAFIRHATGFARMVQDIDAFFVSVGATVGGRIQIVADDLRLQFDGLSSGWVFEGPSAWEAVEQRALALAEELRYVTEGFDPKRATRSMEVLTSFGRSLEGTIYEHFGLGGTHRSETTVQEADLQKVKNILDEVESTRVMLHNVELAPAVASALDLAGRNLNATHEALSRHARDYGQPPNEALMVLHSVLSVLLSQLASLVAEVNLGRRAHKERSDFLRTEFWKHRWRVYELWLLVRVLTALRDSGARVSLNDVQNGVWNLRYGRSLAPAATCHVGEAPLHVYYQLHARSQKAVDMPDIAVIGSQPIIVLDPKHGLSYTRSKVQHVLTRYSAAFAAKLTAIVNYYSVGSYPFEVTSQGDRRWLLASGIVPGSTGAQRLELLVRDAVLVAGHVAYPTTSATLPASHSKSTQEFLTYYTTETVEVDEPAGFWSARAGRGAERLPGFDSIIGSPKDAWRKGVQIFASPTADLWFLRITDTISKETVLWRLTEGAPPEKEDSERFEAGQGSRDNDRHNRVSPSGRYRVDRGPHSKREGVLLFNVVDNRGQESFPLIRCHGEHAESFIWSPDESSFAFSVRQNDERRLLTARLGDRHAYPVSLPGQNPKACGWMTLGLFQSIAKERKD